MSECVTLTRKQLELLFEHQGTQESKYEFNKDKFRNKKSEIKNKFIRSNINKFIIIILFFYIYLHCC